MKKILSLIILLMVFGCETNPPSSPEQTSIAQVFISSNVDGATIYLNNVNTGKVTPDTISAPVGTNNIKLEKDGYFEVSQSVNVIAGVVNSVTVTMTAREIDKVVLLEDFSNESCGPCVASNLFIESIKNYRYGSAKLVAIKYATNFPGRNDPFYLANKAGSDSRISYYSVLFTPTIKIDGSENPISTDSTSVISAVDKRLAIEPEMDVHVDATVNGSNLDVEVLVNFMSIEGFDTGNSVLQIVVTETDIPHNAPNGEDMVYDVARVMLPNYDGTSLSGVSSEGEYKFTQSVAIDPAWNISNVHVVAFVQNNSTKEVFQTGSNH